MDAVGSARSVRRAMAEWGDEGMAGASEARDLAGQALGGPRFGERLRRFGEEYRVEGAMLAALILLCVVLSIIQPRFITAGNIRNVLWQVTAVGIIAIGQTLVILTGGIDLSVGGIAA